MESVQLGGAWKVAQEQRNALEQTLRTLRVEMNGLRTMLQRSEDSRDRLIGERDKLLSVNGIRALQLTVSREHVKRAKEQATIAKESEIKSTRRSQSLEKELSETQSLLVETDRKLHQEKAARAEVEEKLSVAYRECHVVQNQYDQAEIRAEKANAYAQLMEEKAKSLAHAKEQKEKYFSVLVKERDRAQAKLTEAEKQLSKGRGFIKRAHDYQNSENTSPNIDSFVERHIDAEKSKLRSFSAPERMKEQLATEIALRKKLESTVSKLEKDNQALRQRYHNLVGR